MHTSIFYTATIGFGTGILLSSFYRVGYPEILLLLIMSLGCALVWQRDKSGDAAALVLLISVFCLACAVGMARLEWAHQSEVVLALEHRLETEVELTGVVTREPDKRQFTTHLYVETEFGVVLVTTDRYTNVSYGDQVIASGVLKTPEAFETDLGRTFNYPGYLRARGVGYMIRYADVAVVGSGHGNQFIHTLFQFKHAFMRSVEAIIPEPQVGLGEGLLLGVKQALGEDLEVNFRRTGIIHIVVLSGYNVMIVAEAIMRLLSYWFRPRLRVLIGILAIGSFAVMVGLGATVVRASIMAVLVLIARATGRTYAMMRALVFAGVVMLLFNPYLLAFDPGFQLSFLATLSLIVLAPHIEARLGLVPSTFQIREFLTATVSTQLFVLPLLLFSIGELSIVSVLVNVLVLPLVPLAMLLTFIAGLLGMLSSVLALPFAYGSHIVLSYIILIAEWFGGLSFAAVNVPAFPVWVVIVVYAISAWWLYYYACQPAAHPDEHKTANQKSPTDVSQWTIESVVIKSD